MADNTTERLKKLYALATRGEPGEKENALLLLEKLTKKYGVSLDSLDDNVEKRFDMEFHGPWQKKILTQIVYKVCNEQGHWNNLRWTDSGRPCRTQIRVRCTEAQKVEIEFLFDFYTQLYKKEMDRFMTAFVQKHHLFGELKPGESGAKIDDDEWARMLAMMHGMEDSSPTLRLEDGK